MWCRKTRLERRPEPEALGGRPYLSKGEFPAAGPCQGAREARFMTLNKALLWMGLPRSWASAPQEQGGGHRGQEVEPSVPGGDWVIDTLGRSEKQVPNGEESGSRGEGMDRCQGRRLPLLTSCSPNFVTFLSPMTLSCLVCH